MSQLSVTTRKTVQIVGSIDDFPEAIHDADKDEHDKCLSDPLGKGSVCTFDLAAGYRGLVGVGVGSKGAVVWRRAGEKRGSV
tara:strand:- start:3751 stop:3996 length:246 start_codon:yes stop_codon:yes gene_type:complete